MNEKEIISLEKSFALFKIYSKADNINFSIKNLLASFDLKLFIGLKDLKVIGRGSKAFRELFGEVNDVRRSIFEGVSKLSTVARRNEMYEEMKSIEPREFDTRDYYDEFDRVLEELRK